MYECDNNQMPYWNFGPLIKHGSHRTNFIIFTFISENKTISEVSIKSGTKWFLLTWEERVKCKIDDEKNEKKRWILESLEWVFKVQMGYPNHAWTQLTIE
jgi:hypothetical protein